jgi:hypothetical protein
MDERRVAFLRREACVGLALVAADELTLEAAYLGSSAPVKSAIEATLMYSLAPDDEVWHFGVRAGLTAGEWGADGRGPVGLSGGLRVAVDVARPMTSVLGLYLFGQADAIVLASSGDPVLRPALGLGLRAARTIGVEVAFEPLISLGAPFEGNDHVAGGFSFGLSFDFCAIGSWCQEPPQTQTDVDLTPAAYAAAQSLVPADVAGKQALCAAVNDALDAERHPPADANDPTATFLAVLVQDVPDPVLKKKLQGLADLHASSRAELLASRAEARKVAQEAVPGRLLKDHCVYSPFPVELRTQFGCDGAGH